MKILLFTLVAAGAILISGAAKAEANKARSTSEHAGGSKKASPQICPPEGCAPICQLYETRSCTTTTGCSGTSTCLFGGGVHWGPCELTSTSKRSCTSCSGG